MADTRAIRAVVSLAIEWSTECENGGVNVTGWLAALDVKTGKDARRA